MGRAKGALAYIGEPFGLAGGKRTPLSEPNKAPLLSFLTPFDASLVGCSP